MYEVRVLVSTLDEASELLKILAERGYEKVSMGPPTPVGQVPTGALLEKARSSLNRLNDWIVSALYVQKATAEESAVTAEKIVETLQRLPETRDLFGSHREGVVSRTVSMIASSVLGDKFAMVAYAKTQPRKFWLTESGVKKARLLGGSKP